MKKFFSRKKEGLPKKKPDFLKMKEAFFGFWQSSKHRKKLVFILACLIISGVSMHLYGVLAEQDADQTAASRWQSGKQVFAQLSVFLSPEEQWTENDRNSLLSQIRMAFQENSIRSESKSGGEDALLKDCYSCETNLTLANGKKTAEAVVTATGGDFFYFHPQIWLSGYAYSEEDAMQDRIVLDKELAWSLFGSSQVEGMALKINDSTYYVAGVVDKQEDAAAAAAYGESNRAWISYAALERMQEKPAITAYEIVMPNPVSGWAKEILSKALTPESREIVLLENSGRTEFLQVFQDIRGFAERSMVTKAVKYPYWENAARIRDCERELCLFLAVLFLIYPCVCCILGIVHGYHFLCRKLAELRQRFS